MSAPNKSSDSISTDVNTFVFYDRALIWTMNTYEDKLGTAFLPYECNLKVLMSKIE